MVSYSVRAAAVAAMVSVLAACGGAPPGKAVEAAKRLVDAANADDRIAFEVEIDRAAVREDLRAQVAAMAKGQALDVDGGPSEFALDRMIAPAAVRLLNVGQVDFAKSMTMKDGKACVPDAADGCLLTFAKGKGGWRLVGMRATDLNAMSGLDVSAGAPADEAEDN